MAFPEIKSKNSLVAKHVTKEKWERLKGHVTKHSGFTLAKAIACAVEFDNQHCGIYAGDWDSYKDFADVFDPIIQEYHGISADSTHTSDMDSSKITGSVPDGTVKSTRIRVGRNLEGYGLSPGITKQHRLGFQGLMKEAFSNLKGDLAGTYYPLTGMDEATRQQLVDDHFLFMSGDNNLIAAGMARDWPEGRGIFHNKDKTFLVWVNEEDQLRIISMQKGSDVKEVFDRLFFYFYYFYCFYYNTTYMYTYVHLQLLTCNYVLFLQVSFFLRRTDRKKTVAQLLFFNYLLVICISIVELPFSTVN